MKGQSGYNNKAENSGCCLPTWVIVQKNLQVILSISMEPIKYYIMCFLWAISQYQDLWLHFINATLLDFQVQRMDILIWLKVITLHHYLVQDIWTMIHKTQWWSHTDVIIETEVHLDHRCLEFYVSYLVMVVPITSKQNAHLGKIPLISFQNVQCCWLRSKWCN